jgi:hypothetical protein
MVPFGHQAEEFGAGKCDAEFRALVHHLCCAFGGAIREISSGVSLAPSRALVQAWQNAVSEFDGRGSHAERGAAFESMQEGSQRLVQDLVGGLDRMNVAAAGPISGVAVQFLEVKTLNASATSH